MTSPVMFLKKRTLTKFNIKLLHLKLTFTKSESNNTVRKPTYIYAIKMANMKLVWVRSSFAVQNNLNLLNL